MKNVLAAAAIGVGVWGCSSAEPAPGDATVNDEVTTSSVTQHDVATSNFRPLACDDSVYGQFCPGHCFNFNSSSAGLMCASGSATPQGCSGAGCTTSSAGGSGCGAYYAIFRCN